MIDEGSFLGRLLGMVDLFVIWWVFVLAIGLGSAVPPADAADRSRVVQRVCRDCGRRCRHHEPDGGGMTGKKKLLIGVGVVVILGAIAFANFKFKRVEGRHGQRRDDQGA